MFKSIFIVLVLVALILFGAYAYGNHQYAVGISDNSSVQTVVTQFGNTIQKVSLGTATTSDIIGEYYSPYVSAALLSQWRANPASAPGRTASSSWPAYIQINSMTLNRDGSYTVDGDIVLIDSKKGAPSGTAGQYGVTITLQKTGDQWLITNFVRQ